MTQSNKALAAVMLAAALAGCGGGSDEAAPPADPLAAVATEAQQSVSGLLGYLDRLVVAAGAEAREAIDLAAVLLSTSDSTEPVALK